MILLDTHVVIWLTSQPEKLSRNAVLALQGAREEHGGLAISGVTLYEIVWLASRGRIQVRISTESLLAEIESQFVVKPINGRICAATMRLPDSYPKDPMDRIIGATAIVEGMSLVTADTQIQNSGAVSVVW